jgi:hypothetical protein
VSKYGVLSDVVASAGSLMGATAAISAAWVRGAKWLPPEEAVPGATRRVSALFCALVIAVLFVIGRQQLGPTVLLAVTLFCAVGTLIALSLSVFINTKHTYVVKFVNSKGRATKMSTTILGGFELLPEAEKVSTRKSIYGQALLDNANGDPDLVWTRGSRAIVRILSTLGYIFLQALGSIGLAAAGLLLSLST